MGQRDLAIVLSLAVCLAGCEAGSTATCSNPTLLDEASCVEAGHVWTEPDPEAPPEQGAGGQLTATLHTLGSGPCGQATASAATLEGIEEVTVVVTGRHHATGEIAELTYQTASLDEQTSLTVHGVPAGSDHALEVFDAPEQGPVLDDPEE
ncbi:MAG: hypothetical protein QF464_02800, partial [Myxococcota bacterium]|nr:hypothetical protein [Myxococcota bacterium]